MLPDAFIILKIFVITNLAFCHSITFDDQSSRKYVSDSGTIDFVYHNHEDMTKFLR